MRQRNNVISLLRAVSMCSIILCHILQFYGNELAFWFNVAVQIFLILSGYLYACREPSAVEGGGGYFYFIKKTFIKYYLYDYATFNSTTEL